VRGRPDPGRPRPARPHGRGLQLAVRVREHGRRLGPGRRHPRPLPPGHARLPATPPGPRGDDRVRRRLTPHVLAGLASAAVLVPIYLIALSALSARGEVSAWPKALLPRALSLETLTFFSAVPSPLPPSA